MRALLVVLFCLAAAAGCASASGAYRDGMDAETRGDYDAAVHRYAMALRRDASLPNVRGRLVVASREAVRRHLAAAGAAPDATAAADAWLAAETVVATAHSAGVDPERPSTFAADRDRALDGAVYAHLADAASAVDAGDYPDALERLARARYYRPSPARQAELDETAQTAYRYWAEDDLAAGRYRAALAHADAALEFAAPASASAEALVALRGAVLAAGARTAALLPADADSRAYPDRWLRDLDSQLADAVVAADAPFLAYADPARVQRALRERSSPRLAVAGAARVGDRVGADYAVLIRLDRPAETQRTLDRRRIDARMRSGRDTTSYLRLTTEQRIEVGAEITVVGVATERPVCRETVREAATESYRTAVYRGDWRTLDLSRAERELFRDGEAERAGSRALATLRDRLAERAAAQAVLCLSRQIP